MVASLAVTIEVVGNELLQAAKSSVRASSKSLNRCDRAVEFFPALSDIFADIERCEGRRSLPPSHRLELLRLHQILRKVCVELRLEDVQCIEVLGEKTRRHQNVSIDRP